MSDECNELRQLNRDTFKAEEGGQTQIGNETWEMFLRNILGDEFKIRRARADIANQDKEEMINHIKKSGPTPSRRIIDEEIQAWCSDTLGLVICPVIMSDKKYQNIKVFKKQPQGNWQCIYWQVTEAPTGEGQKYGD